MITTAKVCGVVIILREIETGDVTATTAVMTGMTAADLTEIGMAENQGPVDTSRTATAADTMTGTLRVEELLSRTLQNTDETTTAADTSAVAGTLVVTLPQHLHHTAVTAERHSRRARVAVSMSQLANAADGRLGHKLTAVPSPVVQQQVVATH